MQKSLLLIAFFSFCALSVFAQFSGSYTGKVKIDGKDTKFQLNVSDKGRFTLAYDLNPNDLSIKGALKPSTRGVVFEVETTYLELKEVSSRKKAKGFTFTFKKNGKSTTYAQAPIKGVSAARQLKKIASMFGWDEGVAAVVVNHEEQYSRKR